MSLKRYSWQAILLLVAISLLLIGCGGGEEAPAEGGIPSTSNDAGAEVAADGSGDATVDTVADANADVATDAGATDVVAEGGEAVADVTTEGGEAVADASVDVAAEGGEATADTSADTTADTAGEATSTEGGEEAVASESEGGEEAVVTEGGEEATTTEGGEEAPRVDEGEAVPSESEGGEEAAAESTPVPTAEGEQVHVVATGENLYRIGLQYGVSWLVLAEYNQIGNVAGLTVGQEIKIPAGTSEELVVTPVPTPTDEQTHTVADGENLYRIGLQYGLDWTQIAEANGIVNPQQLTVGQILKIPASQPGDSPEFTHVVKDGETLFIIAVQYGLTWDSIAEANELVSPYLIYPDQLLVIPGG